MLTLQKYQKQDIKLFLSTEYKYPGKGCEHSFDDNNQFYGKKKNYDQKVNFGPKGCKGHEYNFHTNSFCFKNMIKNPNGDWHREQFEYDKEYLYIAVVSRIAGIINFKFNYRGTQTGEHQNPQRPQTQNDLPFGIEVPTDEDKVDKMCQGLNKYRERYVPGELMDFTKLNIKEMPRYMLDNVANIHNNKMRLN